MSTAQIHVTIRTDGSVAAETVGVSGPACLDYISVLEDLIAGRTVSSAFTADYAAASDDAASSDDAATDASRATVADGEAP